MRSAVPIAILAGLAALGLVNASIVQKETLIKEGEVVLLELAPVDPRSLMQGDYMALRFRVANEIRTQLRKRQTESGRTGSRYQSQDGTIVVVLDENSVGRFARFEDQQGLGENERLMQFRVRNGRVKFATNAFFFQEGTAAIYEPARYGEFRVAGDGELLLTGMRDKQFKPLNPGTNTSDE